MKISLSAISLAAIVGFSFANVDSAHAAAPITVQSTRDGVPMAIDFCNPAPDAEVASVGQANFEWVVEAVSDMAIRKAREHVAGRDNLSWGKYLQMALTQRALGELV